MSRSAVVLIGLLSLALSTGCANGPPEFDDHEVYVGLAPSFGLERFDLDSGLDADDSAGASLRVGYRADSRFAGEVHLDYFNEYQADLANVQKADLEMLALTVNGKAYLHTGSIQPYGIAGIGVMSGDTVDNVGGGIDRDREIALAFRGGLGLEVHDVLHGIVHHAPVFLFADLSYWLPTSNLSDYQFLQLSIGFAWKFGDHGHGGHGGGHGEDHSAGDDGH